MKATKMHNVVSFIHNRKQNEKFTAKDIKDSGHAQMSSVRDALRWLSELGYLNVFVDKKNKYTNVYWRSAKWPKKDIDRLVVEVGKYAHKKQGVYVSTKKKRMQQGPVENWLRTDEVVAKCDKFLKEYRECMWATVTTYKGKAAQKLGAECGYLPPKAQP